MKLCAIFKIIKKNLAYSDVKLKLKVNRSSLNSIYSFNLNSREHNLQLSKKLLYFLWCLLSSHESTRDTKSFFLSQARRWRWTFERSAKRKKVSRFLRKLWWYHFSFFFISFRDKKLIGLCDMQHECNKNIKDEKLLKAAKLLLCIFNLHQNKIRNFKSSWCFDV